MKHLEAVPGKSSIDSLQKTAILETSHTIRKVLQCEAWSLSGGDHRWFKGSTGEKRLVTRDIHINNNNNNNNNTFWRTRILIMLFAEYSNRNKKPLNIPGDPPVLAPGYYANRHYQIANIVHHNLSKNWLSNVACQTEHQCLVIDMSHKKVLREFFLIFCWPHTLYNLVNKANLVHNFFSMFVSFLYMFRATICPSSGAITVSMWHLVYVTLCGLLSGMQGGIHSILHTRQSSTQSDKYQVSPQLLLLMMGK